MEAIILGNPFIDDLGTVTPIIVPSYEAEEAVIELTTGYNPYVIGGGSTSDSYWIRTGSNILRLISTSDKIVVGGTSFLGIESLRVIGGINITRLTLGGESTYITSIKDEDTLVSNDEHAIPTQQSVKAYIDNLSISGLQPGDNISLLSNNVPYIVNETDPIFLASAAHAITGTNITNWNTAYGWGNHALSGYLTTETDPIFVASTAHSIISTDITHWNDAYSKEHVHNNFSLLQSIIASGDGVSALFNDGTYKTVPTIIGGSDSYVQYNNGGVLGGDSTFFFNDTTKLFSVQDLSSNTIALGSTGVTMTVDGSDNLVFTDSISGSKTLASLIGGATNYWTATTGGIYYSSFISNHINPTAELDITGHIVATDFDSNFVRYKNSNLLLGPNAGDLETDSYLLYVANDDTTTPLIKGDFLNQELTFNADVYVNTVKRLAFGSSSVSIRRDSSDNLEFRDLNANGGNPILLSDLISGNLSLYSLKSDFISYASVNSISAANLVTWGKASVIITSGGGTNFLGDDGVYHAGGSGGVTPTDGMFKFDLGTVEYRSYTDKTEAGGVSSAGKFWSSLDVPTANNSLTYNGFLYATSLLGGTSSSSDNGVTGQSDSSYGVFGNSNTSFGVYGVSNTNTGIYGQSTTGIGAQGYSNDNKGIYGSSVNDIGIEGVTSVGNAGVYGHTSGTGIGVWGSSTGTGGYGIYGSSSTGVAGLFDTVLTNTSSIITCSRDGVSKFTVDKDGNINSSVLKTNGSTKTSGYFYTGTVDPTDTIRLNYDGDLYATKLYSNGLEVLTTVSTPISVTAYINSTNLITSTINTNNSSVNLTAYILNPFGHTLDYQWYISSTPVSTSLSFSTSVVGIYTIVVTDEDTGFQYSSEVNVLTFDTLPYNSYNALTDASTIVWDSLTGLHKKISIATSRILSITNVADGMVGDLILTITSTSTLTLPSGSKLNGSVTSLAAGSYILHWTYSGSTFYFNILLYT